MTELTSIVTGFGNARSNMDATISNCALSRSIRMIPPPLPALRNAAYGLSLVLTASAGFLSFSFRAAKNPFFLSMYMFLPFLFVMRVT